IAIRRTIIELSVQCRLPETKAEVCVSTVSIVCTTSLFSNSSKDGLIASRPTTGSTDDADGADGTDRLFSCCAHPDDSCPRPAFSSKCDLDPKGPQEGLRPPQPAGKRPRVFGPCNASRRTLASTLRAQPQEVRGAPSPGGPVGHD